MLIRDKYIEFNSSVAIPLLWYSGNTKAVPISPAL